VTRGRPRPVSDLRRGSGSSERSLGVAEVEFVWVLLLVFASSAFVPGPTLGILAWLIGLLVIVVPLSVRAFGAPNPPP
jgi:hypothetical protein